MDTNNNIDPLVCQIPHQSGQLWRALLEIYRYYLRSVLAEYRGLPEADRPPPHVREAVAILDCWLDVATEEGWIDEVLNHVD